MWRASPQYCQIVRYAGSLITLFTDLVYPDKCWFAVLCRFWLQCSRTLTKLSYQAMKTLSNYRPHFPTCTGTCTKIGSLTLRQHRRSEVGRQTPAKMFFLYISCSQVVQKNPSNWNAFWVKATGKAAVTTPTELSWQREIIVRYKKMGA